MGSSNFTPEKTRVFDGSGLLAAFACIEVHVRPDCRFAERRSELTKPDAQKRLLKSIKTMLTTIETGDESRTP